MTTNSIEIIAETKQADGIDARANAEFIVRAVNSYEKTRPLIAALVGALELCLASKGLTWEAEQEAEAELVLARVEW